MKNNMKEEIYKSITEFKRIIQIKKDKLPEDF